MMAASERGNEDSVLTALGELQVLDTDPEPEFDALVQVASLVCGVPVSLISLVDANRQWFKANLGLPGVSETPRDIAFCAHAVLEQGIFEVPDAAADPRFADNPLVVGNPDIRFYAGVPLRLTDGHQIGTLCVIDRRPRVLTELQREALQCLGLAATKALEGRIAIRRRAEISLALGEAVGELRVSEAHFRALAEGSPVGVYATDARGSCTYANPRWLEIYGLTLEESLGPGWADALHPEDRDAVYTEWQRTAAAATEFSMQFRVRRPNGDIRHVHSRARAVPGIDGAPVGFVGTVEDITERLALQAELADQHELMRVTLRSIGEALITTDAKGRVGWMNPVAEVLTGWTAAEAQGQDVARVFHLIHEETRLPAVDPVAACIEARRVVPPVAQTVLVARTGAEYGIEDSAAPILDDRGEMRGVVLVFRDVTEARRLSSEVRHRASHDPLTGLVNRRELDLRLQRLVDAEGSQASAGALLYLDLDQFKIVNDVCGHAVGDLLLQRVSQVLTEAVRTSDTVARLGGDEFAVLLPGCPAEPAAALAQKICDRIDELHFVHDGRRFRVGASIGLVHLHARRRSVPQLLKAADAASRAAKLSGRNRVHVWVDSDTDDAPPEDEARWSVRITRALDDERLALHGQRIHPLRGQQEGLRAELFVRLADRDGTLLPARAFLPAAERFNLISRIDKWVLGRAVASLATMPSLDAIASVTVNISGQSLGDRAFHRWAADLLLAADVEVRTRLCFDVPETAVVSALADAAAFFEEVRAIGVRVALDDFGAGNSALGYLRTLPLDYLKIDGEITRNVVTDPLAAAAVRCAVDVAQVLGLQTIAEAVDDPDALARLRELNVDYAQGYLLDRPAPIEGIG